VANRARRGGPRDDLARGGFGEPYQVVSQRAGDRALSKSPVDQLRAIWSSNDALIKKARDLKSSAAGQDIAFVEKSGEVKAVAGVMTGIEGDDLKFKFEGEDRKSSSTAGRRHTGPARDAARTVDLRSHDARQW